MRKKEKKQLPLMIASVDHPHAIELVHISQILDGNSIICEMALQDLTHNVDNPCTGANGMAAEQIVRAVTFRFSGNECNKCVWLFQWPRIFL